MSVSNAGTNSSPQSASQDTLEAVAENVGFVPNLFKTLAQQPGVVEAFVALDEAFSNTSLTPVERQAVLLAASVENVGRYCVAGHTTFSRTIGMAESSIEDIRSADAVDDERLEALRIFVRHLIQNRGHTTREEADAFVQSGFAREQILDVIMGVTLKTFSNYVDSTMQIPLDEQFQQGRWSSSEEPAS